MEDTKNQIGPLFEKATEFVGSSYELIKLKGLDKASDIISTLIPNAIVFVLIASFMLFLNLGVAFWLGAILGSVYYGFFIVAAFYAALGIVLQLFFHEKMKRMIYDNIIKMALK